MYIRALLMSNIFLSVSPLSQVVIVRLLTSHDPECLRPGLGWVLWCRLLPAWGPAGQAISIWSPPPHSVGCGPVCVRNSNHQWECHCCHHHSGHPSSTCTCFPSTSKPWPSRSPRRSCFDPALPLPVLCRAQWLVRVADLRTSGDIADCLTLQPDGRCPGPIPVFEPRPNLWLQPITLQSRCSPAASLVGCMCHRGRTCHGMALSRRSKLLFSSTTSDTDIPVIAVWWLPGGCHVNPAIVCRDLPCGKAARPCHCYPEALPPCKPIICKQTR